MASTLTKEQFISRATKAHGKKFSYEKSMYINMRKPITIICPDHGEFIQSPMNHLKTEGCPACGYASRNKKETLKTEVFFDEPALPNEEEDDERLMERILKRYKEEILSKTNQYIDPKNFNESSSSFTVYTRPVAKNIQLTEIMLTDEVLEKAYDTHFITYEEIDDNSLNMAINDIYSEFHSSIHPPRDGSSNVMKQLRMVAVDWNSIALNPTLKYDQLIKYSHKMDAEYIIHSPAFMIQNTSNPILKKNELFSLDTFISLSKQYPLATNAVTLADDWFDDKANLDTLYNNYIIPRMLNGGYKLSKRVSSIYKNELIEYFTHYIENAHAVNNLIKIPVIICALSEDIFLSVYSNLNILNKLKDTYLERYMQQTFMSDNSLELIIELNGLRIYDIISKYQVPSLQFIKKHREHLDVILIIRSMLKNNRVFTKYIEEFIDELIEYNIKRNVFLSSGDYIQFTGREAVTNEDFSPFTAYTGFSVDASIMPSPVIAKSINYVDDKCQASKTYEYYKEDLLKTINNKISSKLYNRLYESIKAGNPVNENRDMLASIQIELESMLQKSQALQEKFTEYKKSI